MFSNIESVTIFQDNYQKQLEIENKKKPRKKSKPPALTRPPRKGKKKKKGRYTKAQKSGGQAQSAGLDSGKFVARTQRKFIIPSKETKEMMGPGHH